MSTINGVYIIESLEFEEEETDLFEGKVLKQMLEMLDVPVHYTYIRTKKELKVMIEKFEESRFKYLHLSCHGTNEGISLPLNKFLVPFSELSNMFKYISKNKRLFLSSCSVMNGDNILEEMRDTQFLSITGPSNNIDFNKATIFWASFYHLMFAEGGTSMVNKDMKESIGKLAIIFNVEMSTIILTISGKNYNRYDVREKVSSIK